MDLLHDLFNAKGILLIVLVFVPLERLVPMHAEQKTFRRGWLNDLVYLLLNGFLIRFGVLLLLAPILVLCEAVVPVQFKAAVASQPHWLQALELIVLADLGFYSVHRLFHAIPFLWRFHAIHHSIEELDWLAAHRVHPVDQILTKGASLVPCFALGFSEWAIGTFFVLYHWQSVLLHANVRLGLGPLRWIVASPEFHHWHHSKQRQAWDKNFAGQLALWDIVFGTAYMPKDRSPADYGVSDPVPSTYIPQLLYPFRRAGIQRIPQGAEEPRPDGSDAAEPMSSQLSI